MRLDTLTCSGVTAKEDDLIPNVPSSWEQATLSSLIKTPFFNALEEDSMMAADRLYFEGAYSRSLRAYKIPLNGEGAFIEEDGERYSHCVNVVLEKGDSVLCLPLCEQMIRGGYKKLKVAPLNGEHLLYLEGITPKTGNCWW